MIGLVEIKKNNNNEVFFMKQKVKTVARNVSLAAQGPYAFLMGE